MRLKRLERRIAEAQKPKETDLIITDDYIQLGSRKYVAPRTMKAFHADAASTRIVMGPFGSGKSSSLCFEIIRQAANMPFCKDGVRRCRTGIVRNSYKQLLQTSLRTWRHWADNAATKARYHLSSPLESYHTFYDDKGRIDLEILYINIDSILQIDDLKSLELSNSWLNEGSELPPGIISVIGGRCGRYPAQDDIDYQPYNAGIVMCSNPPDEDHWLPKLELECREITGNSVNDYRVYERLYNYVEDGIAKSTVVHIYHQPPALIKNEENEWTANPLAENIKNLGGYKYYFERLQNGDEFIKVYVCGHYGMISNNQVVYENYNDDLHSINSIDVDLREPLILTWDFGIQSPACLVSQYVNGRLYVIKEFCGEWISTKELAENFVRSWVLSNARDLPIESIGDPAGTDHGFTQLEEVGIFSDAARSNMPDIRIDAVRSILNDLVMGKPRLIISRDGCPKLRQGFLGKYYFKRLQVIGEEAYRNVPHKNHPYSDIHDCLQYASLHVTEDIETFESYQDHDDVMLEYNEETRNKIGGY